MNSQLESALNTIKEELMRDEVQGLEIELDSARKRIADLQKSYNLATCRLDGNTAEEKGRHARRMISELDALTETMEQIADFQYSDGRQPMLIAQDVLDRVRRYPAQSGSDIEDRTSNPLASVAGTEADVCSDIAGRQKLGIAKYGTTVASNPLDLRTWLQHAYEECLDQSVYLKRAITEIDGKNEAPITNSPGNLLRGSVPEFMGNATSIATP